MEKDKKWKEELEIIASVFERVPLDKTIKWCAPVFCFKGNNVASYSGFKNFFTIWFHNGVFLKDPYKVLINAQEGKTKSLRQWRFTAKEQIDESKILAYLHEAIDIEKQGLKIKPEKFAPIEQHSLLKEALNSDAHLKACFEKFTPGKQKEFAAYIHEAKQDITRLNRIEKIKPMILNGIGLNDKYK